MSQEWVGVVNTTAPKYLKGAADHTIRAYLIFSMLRKRGRITYNHNGTTCTWVVEAMQPPVAAYGDGGVIDFARHDLYRQLTIDWRGYKATDMMTTKEKLMNDGDVALVKRYDRIMPNLMKAINNKFSTEIYVDGYAAGNENRLVGLESFMGTGTTVAADRLAQPSDTYAGKSTAVAQLETTWTSDLATPPNAAIAKDWPEGAGASGFDWLSPKLINWSSTNWGTSAITWEDNAERCLRQAKAWCTLTGGKNGSPELVTMTGKMFYEFKNKQAAKQRIIVQHKEAEDLGFSDVLNFEGMALHQEYGLTANTAYGINFSEMEMCSLSDDLFMSNGPEYVIQKDAWLFMVGFFGNLKLNPKAFFKLKNYA